MFRSPLSIFYSFSSKKIGYPELGSTFAPREPAKPLHDAQMCGSFCFIMAHHTRRARMGNSTSSPDLIEKNAPTIEKLSMN